MEKNIDHTPKIRQKWGFGMAPLLTRTEARYRSAVAQMRTLLEYQGPSAMTIHPEVISEVKGMINRCIRQDQWDWFTVYCRFGCPAPNSLRTVSSLLPGLRKAVQSADLDAVCEYQKQLQRTPLLTCCLRFLGEQHAEPAVFSNPVPGAGYLYILSSRELPHLLKIGFTRRSVEERVKEINSATGVVFLFSARRVFRVKDAVRAEREIFSLLSDCRIRGDREFFAIDFGRAVSVVNQYLDSESLLNRSSAVIESYSAKKGYGFASCLHSPCERVFFHISEVRPSDQSPLQIGSTIEFDACSGAKGPFAICVAVVA